MPRAELVHPITSSAAISACEELHNGGRHLAFWPVRQVAVTRLVDCGAAISAWELPPMPERSVCMLQLELARGYAMAGATLPSGDGAGGIFGARGHRQRYCLQCALEATLWQQARGFRAAIRRADRSSTSPLAMLASVLVRSIGKLPSVLVRRYAACT
jgi:hypothetical protein